MQEREPGPDPLAVSIIEAARMIGVSRTEMYRMISSEKVLARKHGVRTLVLVESLHAYLATLPKASIRLSPAKQAA